MLTDDGKHNFTAYNVNNKEIETTASLKPNPALNPEEAVGGDPEHPRAPTQTLTCPAYTYVHTKTHAHSCSLNLPPRRY